MKGRNKNKPHLTRFYLIYLTKSKKMEDNTTACKTTKKFQEE